MHSNCSEEKHEEEINNLVLTNGSPRDDEALADSGCTDHFMKAGAPVDQKIPAKNPIQIKMPNGAYEKSTHTCVLRIPGLPEKLREGHVVPGLSHSSLLSIKKLTRGGCIVIFRDEICEIFYNNKLVLTGRSVGPGGLWVVPINGQEQPLAQATEISQNPPPLAAATVYTLPYKQQKMRYMHQTFFAMPAQTLEKAIQNDQLRGFPCMNVKDIRKHLAPSPATAKGRMKKPKQGIRSTRKNQCEEVMDAEDMHPTNRSKTSEGGGEHEANFFCFAALADKEKGTVYTDATGALPVMSLNGKQYYIVMYEYDNNYIHALPVSDLRDVTVVAAVDDFFKEMEEKGHKPRLNVSDNQAANALKNS